MLNGIVTGKLCIVSTNIVLTSLAPVGVIPISPLFLCSHIYKSPNKPVVVKKSVVNSKSMSASFSIAFIISITLMAGLRSLNCSPFVLPNLSVSPLPESA